MDKILFIKRFFTTKTYKFDPPFWEEFLATKNENQFAHWFCGDISVVMVEENHNKGILKTNNQFEVHLAEDCDCKDKNFAFINEFGIDTREETYYKALEYAKELFETIKR